MTRQIYYHGCHPEDLEFSHQSTYAALISHRAHVKGEGCWLLGVRIAAQLKPELCQNDCYEEDLTVYFFQACKESKEYNLIEKSRFQANVMYNSYVDVPFENPIHVFEVHRLHLAKTSSLLATLLYEDGNLFKEETTLKFPNIDPTIFPAILKYIYEGIVVDFESTKMALQMLKAAEELDLPLSFINQCKEYLEQAKNKTTEESDESLPPAKRMKLDSEIFSAHRITLAKTSPVFAAMLFSEMFKPGDLIQIPDVTPQAFAAFLSYAYEGKLNVEEQFVTSGALWDFMYLAKKYLLPDRLLNQCRAWIFSRIHSENFWCIMAQCEENLEQQLFHSCLQILSKFTPFCLQLKNFNEVGLQQLLCLVRQNLLSCPEIDVYNACISWAQHKLVSAQMDLNPQNMLDVFSPVLPDIRFYAMSTQEFLRGPEKSGLIPTSKCYEFF
ncbi:hypothetical protein B566_EDAN007402 [Ephemera danica]|nr:hypothetical protein B566_EDAN007402 [Ephemera danica]